MEAFIGEIGIVGFTFPPKGWAFCNGQVLPIAQNQALFSLLGTMYGGDGIKTFALPNLQGRVPMHFGQGNGLSPYVQGQVGGVEGVQIDLNSMASHAHAGSCSNATGSTPSPTNDVWAVTSTGEKPYSTAAPDGSLMKNDAIKPAGGGQPHSNLQPYLVLNFIICLVGIFPSRN
jgi:microcystin-dependent protein